jgi:hypothetical protein
MSSVMQICRYLELKKIRYAVEIDSKLAKMRLSYAYFHAQITYSISASLSFGSNSKILKLRCRAKILEIHIPSVTSHQNSHYNHESAKSMQI